MTRADARRFGFCVRCLCTPSLENQLTEHHTEGRNSHRNQVVFICHDCHVELNQIQINDSDAFATENAACLEKTRLLVSSRALRFVIEHRERVALGFRNGNRNGVDINITSSGVEFEGPLGAIGVSGNRYFFVPRSEHADDRGHIRVFDATFDGLGGVGSVGSSTGGWARFEGADGGILGRFIDQHSRHRNVTEELAGIRQQ